MASPKTDSIFIRLRKIILYICYTTLKYNIMASTSEKGHAKNIANANLLNTNIVQLGAIYNPSNPKLLLSNLQTFIQLLFQIKKV